MMSANDYPKFSRSDIITVLREANIASVKDADLKNPTFDSVSDLYTRILIYLDVLTEEERGQVDFEALEQLENPDHHTTSAPAMDLYVKLKHTLEMVDCPLIINFKDLLRPDSSRTEFFISALLNYALHKDSKMELIRPLAEELTLLDEQRRQSEANIAQLKAEIAEFEEAEERDSPFVQELEVGIEELSHKIAQLNNEQLSLRATFHKLREESAEMDNKISKAEFDLVQAVQENANLRSLIVQSPDKLQGALEEKKLVLEETKKAERFAMETFQEKAAILEVYEKAFKKMSKSSAQLQLINEQVTNVKAIEKDLKAQKAKLNEDEALYKSLEAKVVERERTVKQLHESLKQLEKEKQVMFDDWTKQLNELKLEVESRRRLLESRQNDVESVVAMVDENTAKANQVKQSAQAKVKQLADKYEEIVKQFHEYTVKFGAVLPSL
ncbi:PREDICTED: probable kinetochore protein NUF2 [Brassica oleracea var. oleracea]|uniref:probable kinetochore protein NUF2 n=1 Tax=Brassica oleracea var. oleracea TaxID=109376 RepID=UPI0006A6D950|nr:PREDICTED: probable kinetochore protein NUF2 [Brassica oleracea var. oleracea]XP_013623246.1 PREDICTED: probable kinetochore protein NUF2 [Brassica oleracea var. oleracea]